MKLRSSQADIGGQRCEILERSVVEVVAEPRKALLAGFDQRALATGAALEQHVALEQRRQRSRSFPREGERTAAVAADGSQHQRRERSLPAGHAHPKDETVL